MITGSGLLAGPSMLVGRSYPVLVPKGTYELWADVVVALGDGDMLAGSRAMANAILEGCAGTPWPTLIRGASITARRRCRPARS